MKFRNFRNYSIFLIFTTIILLSINPDHSLINTQLVKKHIEYEIPNDKLRLSIITSTTSSPQTDFDYWTVFKYFFNNTFICMLYLFFQVNGFLLFFTSVGIQIILTYLTGFLNFNLFQHVPIQIFETVAVLFYYGFSFGIIYTIMFGNSTIWNKDSNRKKPKEYYEYYESKNLSYYISKFYKFRTSFLDEFLKIFGLIFISFLIQNDEYDNLLINSNSYITKGNGLINFGTQCFFIIISSLAAIISAILMNYKFNVNNNLWMGSLIFLLMGTDISVKMLSRT